MPNRKFKIHLNEKESQYKVLQNGLSQVSILYPILFNVYTTDIINTSLNEFMYADNVGLVVQAGSFKKLADILIADQVKIQKYFNDEIAGYLCRVIAFRQVRSL